MNQHLTCIECPIGCSLSVAIENGVVVKVSGNKCPKGQAYAVAEIENPVRTLTSTILAEGLDIAMLPVRTDKPISRRLLMKAMQEIKAAKISKTVSAGEIVIQNLLGQGINVIATRCARRL